MIKKRILLLGAGRSTHTLIHYLLQHANKFDWQLTIADKDQVIVRKRLKGANARVINLDAANGSQLSREINQADIVISMLPAQLHNTVAELCLKAQKNMVTASYVSPKLKAMHGEVQQRGILFLNEIGLDPGLDHLSAMKVLDEIRGEGCTMLNFESFAGGLLANESDTNPWHYKFTWNPRNVVLAGQGTVKFIQEGRYKYIPYHRVFRRTETIEIDGYGKFEGYANRDSLKYLDVYGLRGIPTIYRGTLRRPGFCRAWDVFVQLGATDDSYILEGSEDMTYREFINSFLSFNPRDSVELKLMHYLKIDQDSDIMDKLRWLGIFENKKVGLKNATPAQILQHILEQKWKLKPHDKDMIVMWHQFVYKVAGNVLKRTASTVVEGDDESNTAMSKTVGLPLGIAVKLILTGKIQETGVKIPTEKAIYEPVLQELSERGITFTEKIEQLTSEQVY